MKSHRGSHLRNENFIQAQWDGKGKLLDVAVPGKTVAVGTEITALFVRE